MSAGVEVTEGDLPGEAWIQGETVAWGDGGGRTSQFVVDGRKAPASLAAVVRDVAGVCAAMQQRDRRR